MCFSPGWFLTELTSVKKENHLRGENEVFNDFLTAVLSHIPYFPLVAVKIVVEMRNVWGESAAECHTYCIP